MSGASSSRILLLQSDPARGGRRLRNAALDCPQTRARTTLIPCALGNPARWAISDPKGRIGAVAIARGVPGAHTDAPVSDDGPGRRDGMSASPPVVAAERGCRPPDVVSFRMAKSADIA